MFNFFQTIVNFFTAPKEVKILTQKVEDLSALKILLRSSGALQAGIQSIYKEIDGRTGEITTITAEIEQTQAEILATDLKLKELHSDLERKERKLKWLKDKKAELYTLINRLSS